MKNLESPQPNASLQLKLDTSSDMRFFFYKQDRWLPSGTKVLVLTLLRPSASMLGEDK